MKKTIRKAINILYFSIATGVTYFLVDRGIKKEKKEEFYKPTFHTYTPEKYPTNPTASDFNKWCEHIYKQLNNLKN